MMINAILKSLTQGGTVKSRQPLVQTIFLFAIVLANYTARAETLSAMPGEYLVKMKTPLENRTVDELSRELKGSIKSLLLEQQIVLLQKPETESAKTIIAELLQNPSVELVEPNYIFTIDQLPNDPLFGNLWGLKNTGQSDGASVGTPGTDIGVEKAWDITTGSHKVLVAVIDTGVNYKHPDLQGNIWSNAAEAKGRAGIDDDGNGYVDDIHGIDVSNAVNPSSDPMDDHGHGTHCAGIIGARGNDSKGIVGVNWKVQIMPLKFLSANGSGTMEGAIRAIDYATRMGAKIMSNSWGAAISGAVLLEQAVQRAEKAGALFVAAAGNNGLNIDDMDYYPATIKARSLIAVAAVDNKGQLASFSNYGKEKVHVAGPGVGIYSSILDGYASWSGTSMATPHVAGVAALLLAKEPQLTNVRLKDRLLKTARPLPSLRNKVVTGLVNAQFALQNQKAPRSEE